MSHKFSLLWPNPVGKCRNRYIQIYFHLRILPEYHTRELGLSARPTKLRCCVFNKVFLVNHWLISLIVVSN